MARWIDADLIKNIELIPYRRKSGNINLIIANMAIAGAKQVVDKIPTADVAPVIHAKWKDAKRMTDEIIDWGTCSNCGEDVPLANHCWECGAELEEDDT